MECKKIENKIVEINHCIIITQRLNIENKMTASYRKQLTVNTFLEEEEEVVIYQPTRVQPIQEPDQTFVSNYREETYCKRNDTLIKCVIIAMGLLILGFQLGVDWWFEIPYFQYKIAMWVLIHLCYVGIIITSNMDDICNIKKSTNKNMVFCRAVGYLDWGVAYFNVTNTIILSVAQLVQVGEIMNPSVLYVSVFKLVLYIVIMYNA